MSAKTGRPPKFATPEEMEAAVEEYFSTGCFMPVGPEGEQVYCPTISGLAYHLDMSTESLRRYSEKDQFCAIVKSAKQRVERYLEAKAMGNNATGAIFNLKCNFGWQDKQVIAGDPDAPLLPSSIKVTYE